MKRTSSLISFSTFCLLLLLPFYVCATIQFQMLQHSYKAGDKLQIRITESDLRVQDVDLWAALKTPDDSLFFIVNYPNTEFSLAANRFKAAITPSENQHELLNMTLPPGLLTGQYTLYALYVEQGKNPMVDNFATVAHSNLAQQTTTIETDIRFNLIVGENQWIPFTEYYTGNAKCSTAVTNLPPGMAQDSVCNIYEPAKTAGAYLSVVNLDDGSQWKIEFIITDDAIVTSSVPATPTSLVGFTEVRTKVPATPADGIYPPQSSNGGARWEFQKTQLNNFAKNCSVNTGECWRYDPVKTLHEHCRKAQLHGEDSQACTLAETYGDYFLSNQHWNTSGEYPDCSGGANLPGEGNKCDPKYGAHASVAYYSGTNYSTQQQQQMKNYCYTQGWSYGPVVVDDLEDGFTERMWGLTLQCLIDLAKQGVDTSSEREEYITKLYAMFTGDHSGQVIGAPMHSMDGHECGNYCSPEMDYWMFSPWMASAFLIPSLWEHWVFLEKDPRIAKMIVLFGDAMMDYGMFKPETTGYGFVMDENPTPWVTHYFAVPYDLTKQANDQESDGGFSDLHNPETIFALSAAYFFSCNQTFKNRVDEMYPIFNQDNASENTSPQRIYLWANRGSASTEWFMENASCSGL